MHLVSSIQPNPQRSRIESLTKHIVSQHVEGQFDDAASEIVSSQRMTLPVSVPPPPPTVPALFVMIHPRERVQPLPSSLSSSRSLPYIIATRNGLAHSPYIPIAPRPPPKSPRRSTIWPRPLPTTVRRRSSAPVTKRRRPLERLPTRRIASSFPSSKAGGGELTNTSKTTMAYGTKLVTKSHHGEMMTSFCRIIRHHPSEILIPRFSTNVDPGDLLPLLKLVDRDDQPISLLRNEDILLGRGGFSNQHPGNLGFRSLVATYREAYNALPKGGKGQLARNLCNYVRLSGGRFLEKRLPQKQQYWYECGDERAQAKCSQALRETNLVAATDIDDNDDDVVVMGEETSFSTSDERAADGPL